MTHTSNPAGHQGQERQLGASKIGNRAHPVAEVVIGVAAGHAAVEFALAVECVGARHLVRRLVPEQQPDRRRVVAHPFCQPPRLRLGRCLSCEHTFRTKSITVTEVLMSTG